MLLEFYWTTFVNYWGTVYNEYQTYTRMMISIQWSPDLKVTVSHVEVSGLIKTTRFYMRILLETSEHMNFGGIAFWFPNQWIHGLQKCCLRRCNNLVTGCYVILDQDNKIIDHIGNGLLNNTEKWLLTPIYDLAEEVLAPQEVLGGAVPPPVPELELTLQDGLVGSLADCYEYPRVLTG